MIKYILILFTIVAHAAVSFDGTSGQCLHLGADKSTNSNPVWAILTNNISISFWVEKRAGLADASVYLGWGRVINGGNDVFAIEDKAGAFEYSFSENFITFHIFQTTATVPQTNTPIHVGFSFTGGDSNTAAFYINGDRVSGFWNSTPNNNKPTAYTNEPFRIGSTYAGSTPRARISEVAVWNCYLSAYEFKTLASSKEKFTPAQIRRVPSDCLVIYVPMDGECVYGLAGGGTNLIRDFSANKFNMTPFSSPVWSVPWLAAP